MSPKTDAISIETILLNTNKSIVLVLTDGSERKYFTPR